MKVNGRLGNVVECKVCIEIMEPFFIQVNNVFYKADINLWIYLCIRIHISADICKIYKKTLAKQNVVSMS